jgi:hypothetical protein
LPVAFSFRAWFPLSPGVVLGVLAALSVVAAMIDRASRRRRKHALRRLAARWQMTYSASDQLRVAAKVLGRLPVPGAADVYVTDLIYGARADRYHYLFTVEYTLGAVRAKRRQVRVGAFSEPRGRDADALIQPITFAAEELGLVEQYMKLGPVPNSSGPPLQPVSGDKLGENSVGVADREEAGPGV